MLHLYNKPNPPKIMMLSQVVKRIQEIMAQQKYKDTNWPRCLPRKAKTTTQSEAYERLFTESPCMIISGIINI